MKANAPLIIDPDAVLSDTIAFERFQMIPGWHSQIIEPAGDLKLSQFAPRHLSDVYKPPNETSFRKRFSFFALE
jgi:hypothetical protein